MQYSIFKDKSTEETVSFIQNILKEFNINTKEIILNRKDLTNDVSSVRIYIPDSEIYGTNGKGTNIKNARASGYAEFIERLQTQYIFPFNGRSYIYEPDEKIDKINSTDRKLLALSHYKLLEDSSKLGFKHRISKLKENETVFVPFVSLKNKKMEYFPIVLLRWTIQLSNGTAAGNTYEEALVQGLSEICERYCLHQALVNKLSLPDIPENIYKKYENIKNLISYIEKQGYKVTVKDASLGKGLSVVCTIFEDIKFGQKKFSLIFGSHPHLPIAIERTLTEFLQGNDISNENTRIKEELKIIKDEDDIISIICNQSGRRQVFSENSTIIKNLSGNNVSYNFNKDTWILNEQTDNKTLFNIICGKIYNISDDIFIRDYSFLGFPAVYIYIPKMSDILHKTGDDYINSRLNYYNWYNHFSRNEKLKEDTITSLYQAVMHDKLCSIPQSHLALLCSILMDDKEKIKIHLQENILKLEKSQNQNAAKMLKFYKQLQDYYFSGNTDIAPVLNKFFKALTFKKLKKEIKKHLNYKITDKQTSKYLNHLTKKLHKLYKNNMPNQAKLVNYLGEILL